MSNTSGPAAQGFQYPPGERPQVSDVGNTSSSLQGSSNIAPVTNDASDIQGTLPQDFTLANVKADTKGGEWVDPDGEESGPTIQTAEDVAQEQE